MDGELSRRRFLARAGSALLAGIPLVSRWRPVHFRLPAGPHPTPRPGITAAKVLTAEQLTENPKAVQVFDLVREIPEIIDGIRCQCGCADRPDFYSLLSCYEGDGMAQHCPVCQGQARLAHRFHKDGKTLDEIRAAVDARYG